MPNLNRRLFLQMTSAAGLAPVLPALPANSAVVARSASSSQMLWASLFAKAGNVKSAADVARTVGVPNAVAKNIYTKLTAANIVAIPGSQVLGQASKSAPHVSSAPTTSPAPKIAKSKATKIEMREWLLDDQEDEVEFEVTSVTEDEVEK